MGSKGACGHPANSNGNCFNSGCWNSNSKRNEDGRGGEVKPIVPMPNKEHGQPPTPRDGVS